MSDLDRVLDYFDSMRALVEVQNRPVYAETCSCGASVEVGREATPAERRHVRAFFQGRHRLCPTAPQPAEQEAGR